MLKSFMTVNFFLSIRVFFHVFLYSKEMSYGLLIGPEYVQNRSKHSVMDRMCRINTEIKNNGIKAKIKNLCVKVKKKV